MRLTTPRLEIEEGNAFEQDVLDRKKFGVSLMNLVSRSDDALVIALNAPWGEGKTTFIKMWQGHLRENNVNSIYFDAFENDYVDDAFIAITSQIVSFIEMELSSTSSAKKKLKDLKKNAAKVGSQLLIWTAKLGIKAATLGVINASDIETLNDIKSDLAKDTSEVLSKFVQERIQSHKKNIHSIKSFKDTLSATADIIRKETGKPLVVIIDELDRCKPTYAVEIIEKIKHLFSVPNVVFILVMHKPQLEEAVKSVYGQGVNANIYLQKFINIECSLPKNTDSRNINDYKRYCDRLYQLHELETWNDKSELLKYVAALARHFDLSLRDLEKCFTYISIFYGSVSERNIRIKPIIALLAILKTKDQGLYRKIAKGGITLDELIQETEFPEEAPSDEEDYAVWYTGQWIKFCLLSDKTFQSLGKDDDLRRFDQGLFQFGTTRQRIIPYFAEYLDIVTLPK